MRGSGTNKVEAMEVQLLANTQAKDVWFGDEQGGS